MAKIIQKEKAKKLRRSGLSINEISKQLNVSKGSVSYWCRDISLSKKQIQKLLNKKRKGALKGLLLASENKRKERIKNTVFWNNKGAEDVALLNTRDLFMLGLGLYWGEGYKKGNEETAFTNSDPQVIKLLINWLKEIYGVEKDDLIFRISINQIHKKRIDKIINFWSQTLKVSKKQFSKTSFIRAKYKKIYTNSDEYFGTLRVKVRRAANLRRRILGSINAIRT